MGGEIVPRCLVPRAFGLLLIVFLVTLPALADGASCQDLRRQALSGRKLTADTAAHIMKEVARGGVLVLPGGLLPEGDDKESGLILSEALGLDMDVVPSFVTIDELAYDDVDRAYVVLVCDAGDILDPDGRRFCAEWSFTESTPLYGVPVCLGEMLRAEYLKDEFTAVTELTPAENLCDFKVTRYDIFTKGFDTAFGDLDVAEWTARRAKDLIWDDGSLARRCQECDACADNAEDCSCPQYPTTCDTAHCAKEVVFTAARSVDAIGMLRLMDPRVSIHVGKCEGLATERRRKCYAEKTRLMADLLGRYVLELETLISHSPLIRCRDQVRRVLEDDNACASCFDLAIDCYENNLGHQIVRSRMSQEALGVMEGALREAMPWFYLTRDLGMAGATVGKGLTDTPGVDAVSRIEYTTREKAIRSYGLQQKEQAEAASRMFFGLYCMRSCALDRNTGTIGAGPAGWMLEQFSSHDLSMAHRYGGKVEITDGGDSVTGASVDIGVALVLGPSFRKDDGTLDQEALSRCPRGLLASMSLGDDGTSVTQRQAKGARGLPWKVHLASRSYLACPHNQLAADDDGPQDRAILDVMRQLCESGPYAREKGACSFNGRLAVGGSERDTTFQTALWGATGVLLDSTHKSSFKSRIVHELVPDPAKVQALVFGVITTCTAPDEEPVIVTVAGGPVLARGTDGIEVLDEQGAWTPTDRQGQPLSPGSPPWFYTIRELERTAVSGRGTSIIEHVENEGTTYPVVSDLVGAGEEQVNPYFRELDPALMANLLYHQSDQALPGVDDGYCMHLYTGGYSKSGTGELLGHGASLLYTAGAASAVAEITGHGKLATEAGTDAAQYLARSPYYLPMRINTKVGGAGSYLLTHYAPKVATRLGMEVTEGAATAGANSVRRAAKELAEEAGGEAGEFAVKVTAGETARSALDTARLILAEPADDVQRELAERMGRGLDDMMRRGMEAPPRYTFRSPSTLVPEIWDNGAFTVPKQGGWFKFTDDALRHLDALDGDGWATVAERLHTIGFSVDQATALMAGMNARMPKRLPLGSRELGIDIGRTIGKGLSELNVEKVAIEMTEGLGKILARPVTGTGKRTKYLLLREGFDAIGPEGQLLLKERIGDEAFKQARAAFAKGAKEAGPFAGDPATLSRKMLDAQVEFFSRKYPPGMVSRASALKGVANNMDLRHLVSRFSDGKTLRAATYSYLDELLPSIDTGAIYAKHLNKEFMARGGKTLTPEAFEEATAAAHSQFQREMVDGLNAILLEAHIKRTGRRIALRFGITERAAIDMLGSVGFIGPIREALERVFSREALSGGQPAARDLVLEAIEKVNAQALDGGLDVMGKATSLTATEVLQDMGLAIGTATGMTKHALRQRALHYSAWRGIARQSLNKGYGLDWTQPLFSYSADLWRLAPEGGAVGARFRDRERATLPLAVAGVCDAEGNDAVHITPRCGEGADRAVCDGEWVPVSPDDELGKLQDAAMRSPKPCRDGDPEEECLDDVLRVLPDGRCVSFHHESEVSRLEYLDGYLRARRALLSRVRDDLLALRNVLEQQCGRCLADVRVLGATYGGCTSTDQDAPPLIGNAIADHDEAGLSVYFAEGLSYASAAALCTATCTQWEGFDVEACPLVTRVGTCMTEGDSVAPGAPGTEPAPSAEGIATCVRDVLRTKRACTLRGLRVFTSNVTWNGAPTAELGANLRTIIMEEGTDNPCGSIERLDEMDTFLDAYLTTLQGMDAGWERMQEASRCIANAPYPDMDPCACVPFPESGQGNDDAYRALVALWKPRHDACVAFENGEVAAKLFEAAAHADTSDLILDDFSLLLEQLVIAARGDLEPGAADLLRDLYRDMPADAVSEDAVAPVGMLWDIAHDIVVEADQQIPFMLSPKYDEGVLATLLDGECQCTGGDDTGCFQGIHERGAPACTAEGELDEQCLGDRIADALRDRPLATANGAVFGDEGVGIVPGSCTFACGNPTTGPNEQGTFPACVRCPDEIWSVNPVDCDVEHPYPFDTLADRTAFIINASYPGPIPMVCSLKAADRGREIARRTLLQATIASIASLDVRRIFPDPECFDIEGGGLDPYERVHEAVSCQDACSMFRSPGGVPGSLYGYCRASVSADGTVAGECHCAWDDDPVGVHTGRPCPLPQGAAVYRALQTYCRDEYGCRGFTNAFNAQEGRFACLCNGMGPLDVDLADAVRDELSDLRVVSTIFEVEGEPVGPDGPHRAFFDEEVVGCAELENTGMGQFRGTVTSALVDRRGLVEGEEAVDEVILSSGDTVVVCTTPTTVSDSLLGSGGAATLALRMSAMTGERSVLEERILGTPLRVAFGQPGLDEARMEGDVSEGATTVGARVYPVAVLRNNRNSPLDAMVTVAVVDERGRAITTDAIPVAGVPPGESFTVEGEGHDVRVEDVGKRIRAKVTVVNDFGVPVLDETGGPGIRVVAPTLIATDVSFVDETESLRAASIGPCDLVSVNVVLENPTTASFSGTVEVGLLHERSGTVLGLTRTHITVDAGGGDVLLSSNNVRPQRQGTFRAHIRAVGGDDIPWRLVPGPAARTRLNVPADHPCEGAPVEDAWEDDGDLEVPEGTIEASTFADLKDAPAWVPEGEVAEEGTQEGVPDTSVPDEAPVDVTCPDDPPSNRYDLVYCTGSACMTREDMNGGRYMRIEGCFCPTGITPRIEETVHGSKLSAETATCCVPCHASRAG